MSCNSNIQKYMIIIITPINDEGLRKNISRMKHMSSLGVNDTMYNKKRQVMGSRLIGGMACD